MKNILRSLFAVIHKREGLAESPELDPFAGEFLEVGRESIEEDIKETWKSSIIPQRQYEECTRGELDKYRKGNSVEPFDTFVTILKDNISGLDGKTLLEIGCSSGYYSEVLQIKGLHPKYSGCDFSESFITFARELYPKVTFKVEDARHLSYADGSFDIVVSGCCLLHILEYPQAIEETARVSKEYVVFHRTPVLHKKETSYYVKTAYGIKMFEIHFNEREILHLMAENGLSVIDIMTFNVGTEATTGDLYAYKTYLCRKDQSRA